MDIVDIAINQIGTSESNSGHMKYINWYGGFGKGTPWCAIFVSWCANQAGVSTSVIPKYSSCSVGESWFKKQGLFKNRGSYTPKRGDIVFFTTNRSHTGIVELVNGSNLHTVEGNTSDKVDRRSYALSNATITGYGIPKYSGTNNFSGNSSSSSSSNSSEETDVSQELAYLKKILQDNKNKTVVDAGTWDIAESKSHADVAVKVTIKNGEKKFTIPILDDMKISYERVGSPGKLTFSTMVDEKFPIQEGNYVYVKIDDKEVFFGFVFSRQRAKDNTMDITAYDQLRYLKNKDSYFYNNKSVSQLLKMIAKDYNLTLGTVVDTKHVMSRIEIDVTLFDLLQNALDETLLVKNEMYVLYDDVGRLTLKNISQMKLKTLIDEETATEYTYGTSIDSNTYNQVKLGYENKEKGTLDIYMERDADNINNWGLLQYFEKIDNPKLGKLKSKALLQQYNRKTRTLSISDAFGNIGVIAGSMIPIMLNLGDIKVKNFMVVEKVTHKYKNREHKMDLILSGGDFVVS